PTPAPMPDPYQQPMYQQPMYQQPMYQPQPSVDVQPAQFQNFDFEGLKQERQNIGIIRDVPLEVTVELGRTHKLIKEILDFSPGTVIELDKIAGEPIDIFVNGKNIAKGEVVVIDENFGIRITDIVKEDERI
ncbi:MAG: flagellar motor switch protein FliN, partial [Firmicutes bacterium]|nr:flagellar motor switch protein FliN [Bacillota bacterium]